MLTIFTVEQLAFLKAEGFSHILRKGVIDQRSEKPYILVPLMPGDNKINSPDPRVIEIEDDEVIEMANGDPFISFSIELETLVLEKYLASTKPSTLTTVRNQPKLL